MALGTTAFTQAACHTYKTQQGAEQAAAAMRMHERIQAPAWTGDEMYTVTVRSAERDAFIRYVQGKPDFYSYKQTGYPMQKSDTRFCFSI